MKEVKCFISHAFMENAARRHTVCVCLDTVSAFDVEVIIWTFLGPSPLYISDSGSWSYHANSPETSSVHTSINFTSIIKAPLGEMSSLWSFSNGCRTKFDGMAYICILLISLFHNIIHIYHNTPLLTQIYKNRGRLIGR